MRADPRATASTFPCSAPAKAGAQGCKRYVRGSGFLLSQEHIASQSRSPDQRGHIDGAVAAAQFDGEARGIAGDDAADDVVLRDLFADVQANRGEARDQRSPAAAMIDDDDIAVIAETPGIGDLTDRKSN